MKVYATNVIYSRIIGLQVSGRDDLKNDLAPVPVAMFDNSGDMRVAKIKSTLKRELQVETLNRHTDQDNSLIVNGSDMLWKSPGLCRQGSDLDAGMFKKLVFTWYSTDTGSIASKTILETPDRRKQSDSIVLR